MAMFNRCLYVYQRVCIPHSNLSACGFHAVHSLLCVPFCHSVRGTPAGTPMQSVLLCPMRQNYSPKCTPPAGLIYAWIHIYIDRCIYIYICVCMHMTKFIYIWLYSMIKLSKHIIKSYYLMISSDYIIWLKYYRTYMKSHDYIIRFYYMIITFDYIYTYNMCGIYVEIYIYIYG